MTTIAVIDLHTVTGGRSKDPDPPGEIPPQLLPNKKLGDWHIPFGGGRGEATR